MAAEEDSTEGERHSHMAQEGSPGGGSRIQEVGEHHKVRHKVEGDRSHQEGKGTDRGVDSPRSRLVDRGKTCY